MTGIDRKYSRRWPQPAGSEGAEKENQHWERWAKKRTFVRALEGTYSHLYKQLIEQPRVYLVEGRAVEGRARPLRQERDLARRPSRSRNRSRSHIEAYAPGAYGQKHGHLNSAVFYVLKGRGHDVHDGRHIPWKAGDVMIVENGCVHQHFNDDPDEEAILLVFKAKPLFLFMHLLFQKIVDWPPKMPPKGAENYKPPTDHLSDGEAPWHTFEDRSPRSSGNKTRTFRADDVEGVAGVPQGLREPAERRARPRTCRASIRADGLIKHLVHREDGHAGDVRRRLHAVPQARREDPASTGTCGKR